MYNPNIYTNNPYMNYGNYYNQQPQQPQQVMQQPVQPNMYRNVVMSLQGKQIDSLDVVKATDIPLDGSISYFPLADGTAIATKQLLIDGTSKITIFKPVEIETPNDEQIKYITENDLKAHLSDFNSKDIKDIKEEIRGLKKRIREITDEIKTKKEE